MIQSVVKAIRILRLFSTEEPRLSLTEISKYLDMPTSTTYNLLITLVSEGFLEKVDDDTYGLGTEIVRLTQHVRVNVELRDRAAHLLRSLADSSQESVYLTVKDGDFGLYIYAIESSHRLQARTAIGDRVKLHCTGIGKAILSMLTEEEVDGIIERVGLPAYTAHTLIDAKALKKDLKDTRERGYSLDVEEHELMTFCIGAPIVDRRGQVIGACSVSGSDREMIEGNREAVAAKVLGTAREISSRMGYVPSRVSNWNIVP